MNSRATAQLKGGKEGPTTGEEQPQAILRGRRERLPRLRVEGISEPIFELPPAKSTQQSVIALSLAKAGSTMFFEILRGLCEHSGLTYVNFAHAYFVNGVDPSRIPKDERKIFRAAGYCYAGFRSIPTGYSAKAVRSMKKMLLVRDMRDTLVSRYFSGAHTHPMPGSVLDERYRDLYQAERDMLIRECVNLGVLALMDEYRTFWDRYKREMRRSEFKVWRYEDVVFNKAEWAREICDYAGLVISEEDMGRIANTQDIFPEEERREFIRKVTPGDYKEKLSPVAVSIIDRTFADYQTQFGYLT